MTSLLQKQRIAVKTEGEIVVLSVGNAEMKMPYDTAIQLSTWLRIRGKEAKRVAGDNARHWSIVGCLDAVMHGERPW